MNWGKYDLTCHGRRREGRKKVSSQKMCVKFGVLGTLWREREGGTGSRPVFRSQSLQDADRCGLDLYSYQLQDDPPVAQINVR